MYTYTECFVFVIVVTSLLSPSTDAASCHFQVLNEFSNYTGICYANQPIPNQFPANVTSLFLGIPYGIESYKANDYLNSQNCSGTGYLLYLPADKAPISGIVKLEDMTFCNFNFGDGRAKQISPYLEHVKDTLVTLGIWYGKLSRLNAGILRGFKHLRTLEIVSTGLENIEPGAFNEITSHGPALIDGLYLTGNKLKSFDWAVLEPVALNLEDIRLDGNTMESMQISRPVIFPNLLYIGLSANNLRTISAAILKSWPSTSINLAALGNPFCPADSFCRCCSVRPLWEYALNQGVYLGMTCGPTYKDWLNCNNDRNTTTPSRRSKCSAGCNIVWTQMVDLAQYEDCKVDTDPNAMACVTKISANKSDIRFKKERSPKRETLLSRRINPDM